MNKEISNDNNRDKEHFKKLKTRMKDIIKNETIKLTKEKENGQQMYVYNCTECDILIKDDNKALKHIENYHNQAFRCEKWKYMAYKEVDLEAHDIVNHMNDY